jgi:hypothetical protein
MGLKEREIQVYEIVKATALRMSAAAWCVAVVIMIFKWLSDSGHPC